MKRSVPASAHWVVLRRGMLSVDPSRHACRIGEAALVLTSREMECWCS